MACGPMPASWKLELFGLGVFSLKTRKYKELEELSSIVALAGLSYEETKQIFEQANTDVVF